MPAAKINRITLDASQEPAVAKDRFGHYGRIGNGENTVQDYGLKLICGATVLLCGALQARAEDTPQFRDLFNGKDLSGWVNVNTEKETWTVRELLLVCSGHPIGQRRDGF